MIIDKLKKIAVSLLIDADTQIYVFYYAYFMLSKGYKSPVATVLCGEGYRSLEIYFLFTV